MMVIMAPHDRSLGALTGRLRAAHCISPRSKQQRIMLLTQVSQPGALLDLGPSAFVSTFVSFAADVLGLNASLVSVSDHVLDPGSRLSAGASSVGMDVDFQVRPPDSFSSAQVSAAWDRPCNGFISCRAC